MIIHCLYYYRMMNGTDNGASKGGQPDGTMNVNKGIQQLNLDQTGQEDTDMDLGLDGDFQVEHINLEQA